MKTKIMWLSAIVMAMPLLMGGCTHKPFHPTKSDREWAADHKACEESVREDIRQDPDVYDNLDEMKMIKSCMKAKGWRWERADWFRLNQKENPAE